MSKERQRRKMEIMQLRAMEGKREKEEKKGNKDEWKNTVTDKIMIEGKKKENEKRNEIMYVKSNKR